MSLLTEEESRRIAQAVEAAERKSGGEITTAVIAESDDYGFRELLFAVVVGVAAWIAAVAAQTPLTALLERLFWGWEPWMLSGAQGAVGMVTGLLAYYIAQIPAVDRIIVPRAVRHEAVARRARRHFVDSGTYDTVDQTGILIFVSILERRVELIADRGINRQVAPDTWSGIVGRLTDGIRGGKLADALVEAVSACGEVLEGRVTRRSDDTNELTDRPDQLEKGS
ncbi:MAG: hypothetical protein MI724_05215 [Spirochaetales bacterium]|nr:hypothetical protein [Spirochaetales bacterium]